MEFNERGYVTEIEDADITDEGTLDLTSVQSDKIKVGVINSGKCVTKVIFGKGTVLPVKLLASRKKTLKEIVLPDGITEITENAFIGFHELQKINIPKGVIKIGAHAFDECKALTSIVIPDGVTRIGKFAFSDCSELKKVKMPDSVTTIGEYAFCDCNALKAIVIPKGVTEIERCTFYYCRSLQEVIVPESVATIRVSAFSNCVSLKNVTILGKVTKMEKLVFSGDTSLTGVCIGDEKYDFDSDTNNRLLTEGHTYLGKNKISYGYELIDLITSQATGNRPTEYFWCPTRISNPWVYIPLYKTLKELKATL